MSDGTPNSGQYWIFDGSQKNIQSNDLKYLRECFFVKENDHPSGFFLTVGGIQYLLQQSYVLNIMTIQQQNEEEGARLQIRKSIMMSTYLISKPN
ncbi:hypothetical protein [Candidatus Lokiarchaeum ossiferum]|uniref:hypothetical protein n=1 Tax=Candidatus Lokiarchaeum ossiferum TaxID=2951803 RepID=UPI00352CD171